MPISDILAEIRGEKQSSVPLPSPAPKRKADGELQRTTDKLVRKDQLVGNITTTTTQNKKPTNIQPVSANSGSSMATSSNARVTSPASNGIRGASTSAVQPVKEPKKGSYAEILARAKAAQATLGMVGKIQHKAIEKGLSKRERQELKKDQASRSYRVSKSPRVSGTRTSARDGHNGAHEKSQKITSRAKAPQAPEKKIKKAALATTGYTGTARPNPAAAKSSKSTIPLRTSEKSGYGRSSSDRRNAYTSEDEEDEDEEDNEGDYGSDVSSDMEADVFEVDEEEEKAARIARREDEEAIREEAHHQREKEEKRRRLANMARDRR